MGNVLCASCFPPCIRTLSSRLRSARAVLPRMQREPWSLLLLAFQLSANHTAPWHDSSAITWGWTLSRVQRSNGSGLRPMWTDNICVQGTLGVFFDLQVIASVISWGCLLCREEVFVCRSAVTMAEGGTPGATSQMFYNGTNVFPNSTAINIRQENIWPKEHYYHCRRGLFQAVSILTHWVGTFTCSPINDALYVGWSRDVEKKIPLQFTVDLVILFYTYEYTDKLLDQ